MPRTLFIYSNFEELPSFFVLDGDYSHLQGTLINTCAPEGEDEQEYEKKQDELNSLIYTEDGAPKVDLTCKVFPRHESFNHVVNVGWVP